MLSRNRACLVSVSTGLIYAATSSPSGEHHGTHRLGDNLYCDSVLALRATTGELVWYRQIVHHNIWNYVGANVNSHLLTLLCLLVRNRANV